jgi:two-component system response regulator
LLDLKLPGLDGIEVLKKLKFTPALCNIPVIVLTSSEEDADIR